MLANLSRSSPLKLFVEGTGRRLLATFVLGSACFFVTGPGEVQAQAVVAGYQDDFQPGTVPAGWQYLWNATGAIDDPANYLPLEADGSEWDTDASNPGRPDPVPGNNLHLSATGGHPGNGSPDRYAIAAFTVSEAGLYRIENSFLTMASTSQGGSADGVEVRVQVNRRPATLSKVALALETIRFDLQLGYLDTGDTIYVAFGENGTHIRDAFNMDFTITMTPSPVVVNFPRNGRQAGSSLRKSEIRSLCQTQEIRTLRSFAGMPSTCCAVAVGPSNR